MRRTSMSARTYVFFCVSRSMSTIQPSSSVAHRLRLSSERSRSYGRWRSLIGLSTLRVSASMTCTSRLRASLTKTSPLPATTLPGSAFSPQLDALDKRRLRRLALRGDGVRRVLGAAAERAGRRPGRCRACSSAPATAASARRRGGAGAASPTRVGAPESFGATAARAARISSPALAGRSLGSLASARRSTSSSAEGRLARSSDVRGGGWKRCAHSVATSFSRSNGTWPVSASNSTQPSE